MPLRGAPDDYDSLLDKIGAARFVLLGEASHGTHEFYRERALITRRLLAEKGFQAVAVEADWPDAYRVNRFVRGNGADPDAESALGGFKRFPAWMWRNQDVLDFVGWLRGFNTALPESRRVGFYGLDLYSLYTSIDAVLSYLDKVDPEAARRARYRYSCFEHFGDDTQAYGYATSFGLSPSCERDVIQQLVELRARASEYAHRDGRVAVDELFSAEQNARLIRNAEAYYRSMFQGAVASWNLRDQHMFETLEALAAYIDSRGAKLVVWAHNSHLGDARATEMGTRGEWNLGQLVSERHGSQVVRIGFSTYEGTVTAASDWDGPAERKRVRPALASSYEALFHELGVPAFGLWLQAPELDALRPARLERAIGVIYRPETERISHYFHASLPDQFHAMLHFHTTRAVEPLERISETAREPAETFPSAL